MVAVAGRNRTNRPYFFNSPDGKRVEFPAMGVGEGELEGRDLEQFNALVAAGQIEVASPEPEPKPEPEPAPTKRGRPRKAD